MNETGDSPHRLLMARVAVIAFYCLLVILPLITAARLQGSIRQLSAAPADSLLLLIFPVLALQPVLAARLKFLDRQFGIDNVYIFHKIMGTSAGALLFCEPFLRAAGGGDSAVPMPFRQGWPLVLGDIAAVLVLLLVTTALLYKEIGLSFEKWRLIHNLLALSVLSLLFIMGFAYQLLPNAAEKGIWIALSAVAGTAYGFHKVAGPALRRRHAFVVRKITRETPDVWTLQLQPPAGAQPLAYLPGQFQFLTFYRGRNLPVEEHPFTISSSPAEKGFHASTIKRSGDFTRTIGLTRKGDRIAVQAPYGRFSYLLHPREEELVFIAGGIGITPFMSMIRHMRDMEADKRVLLLYANSKEEDIVFRGELEAIASGKRPRLRLIHILSRPGGDWQGERGHVNRTLIERYIPARTDRTFYLCGPPAMMMQIGMVLTELGVPSARIRSERFAL